MRKLGDAWREESTGWWKEPLIVWGGEPAEVEGRASIPANGERSRRGGIAGKQFRGRGSEEWLRVFPGRSWTGC